MEILYFILGAVMIYTWIHSIVLIVKKTNGLSTYELVVMFVALASAILYILGTL